MLPWFFLLIYLILFQVKMQPLLLNSLRSKNSYIHLNSGTEGCMILAVFMDFISNPVKSL